eukprot:TRINITY_DN6978_c0_g1_i1.p1 TRINITY_DN6978_c0_g1~~TRINITY_DN6978_c0_g1_i1.p1  ORF type:complete len:358 (+),score=27.63 TRINITY_DN6978_c0_g1_i1:91-1164(+)
MTSGEATPERVSTPNSETPRGVRVRRLSFNSRGSAPLQSLDRSPGSPQTYRSSPNSQCSTPRNIEQINGFHKLSKFAQKFGNRGETPQAEGGFGDHIAQSSTSKHGLEAFISSSECTEEQKKFFINRLQRKFELVKFIHREFDEKELWKSNGRRVVLLPATKKSRTLVVDLIGTLVAQVPTAEAADFSIPGSDNAEDEEPSGPLHFKIRPHLQSFLNEISPTFEIFVFSDAPGSVTRAIVAAIDPKRRFIHGVFHRAMCIRLQVLDRVIYVKDLRIFVNRRLRHLIALDDDPLSYPFQLPSLYPIPLYRGGEDTELKRLGPELLHLASVESIIDANGLKYANSGIPLISQLCKSSVL